MSGSSKDCPYFACWDLSWNDFSAVAVWMVLVVARKPLVTERIKEATKTDRYNDDLDSISMMVMCIYMADGYC